MESILVYNSIMESSNRDDFNFYNPIFTKNVELIKKSPHKVIVFDEIIEDLCNGTTPSEGKFEEQGIYFFRSQNFSPEGLDFEDMKYVTQDFHNKLKRSALKPEDILIAVVGATIGVVSIVPKDFTEGNINQNVSKITLKKSSNILPYYIMIFLDSKFGKFQLFKESTITAKGYINNDKIKKLLIIIPHLDTQKKISELMQSAYKIKKQKLRQAEEELKGINYYVLKELNIEITDILTKKGVLINFKELEDRDDAIYYTDGFDELKNKLLSLQIPTKPLGELLSSLTSGARPKGGVNNIEEGILSLGGLHINNKGELDFLGKEKYIPYEFHKENISSKIQAKDILIVKDGATTGKIAIVPEDFNEEVNINEHLFRLRLKEDYNTWYVFSYLFSKTGQMQIQHFKSGATVMGITRDAVNSILIPIPNNSTQEKIELELKNRMGNSKRLTKDAEHIVAYSKLIVEKLIIGEELSKQEEDFANNVIKEAKKLGFIPQ